MKFIRITAAVLIGLLLTTVHAAERVTEHSTWSATYPVSAASPRLVVSNIWGGVSVKPGPPGTITLEVDERRSAPTRELFDRSLDVLRLETEADASGVALIVGGDERQRHRDDNCRGCRVDYQLALTVPAGASIDVGTVMDGRVTVEGITGPVSASNINGPVSVTGARDCTAVESVNGPVDLRLADAPGSPCRLATINGDITLGLPAGAGIDVALDLFNGRAISEFEVAPLAIPAEVEEFEEGGRYRYRITQPAGIRLGGGGPLFSFSSINGDVRIESNP